MSILTYTNIDLDGYTIDFVSYFHEKGIVDYYIENIHYLSHNGVSKDFLELVNKYFHSALKQNINDDIQVIIITDKDAQELCRSLIQFGAGFIAINKKSDPISMLIIENEISKTVISNKNQLNYSIIHEIGHLKLSNNLNYDEILSIVKSRLKYHEKSPSVDLICILKNIVEDIWVNKKIATKQNVNLGEYFAVNHHEFYVSKINDIKGLLRALNYVAICVLSDRLKQDLISLYLAKKEIKQNRQFETLFLATYHLLDQIFEAEVSKENLSNAIVKLYELIAKFRFTET